MKEAPPHEPILPRQKLSGSLSLRIMLMFIFLIGLVLTAVTFLISLTLRLYLIDEIDNSLISSGRIIATQTVDSIVNGSEVQVLPSDFYVFIDLNYGGAYEVAHEGVRGAYGAPQSPKNLIDEHNAGNGAAPFTAKGTYDGKDWRAIVVPLRTVNSAHSAGSVLIALPLAPVSSAVGSMLRVMIALAIIIILLGAFFSYFMAQQALSGVRSIEKVAHQVAAGNFTSRVPDLPPNTEIGALALSINTMLANIEQSFASQKAYEQRMRQFISDASHELRTPLATVRGYAELYRMGGVPAEEINHAFARIEAESTRMGNLVEDLLKLARLNEKNALTFSEVNITESAIEAVNDFLVREPQRQARVIGLDGGLPANITVMADSDKVQQMIANLLSNVSTHTPADAAVEVAVGLNPALAPASTLDSAPISSLDGDGESKGSAENGAAGARAEAIIEVRDHGPGIKESDRKRIFQRFYRTDTSRSRDTGGTGLGLSIVAATMAAHGGSARVYETSGGGLTVRLTFPNVVTHPSAA